MTNAPNTTSFSVQPVTLEKVCCDPIPHLSLNEVNVAYNGITVLRDVSFKVYTGCITALIGPSGCGKTSLLSSINRMTDLISGAQVTGSIEFDGQNILDHQIDLRQLRQQIGMVFQKPNPFPLSIYRNLELPLKEQGLRNKSDIRQRIQQAFMDVGLWDEVKDRLQQPALGLSGGQQQRLCIARALVLQPKILLMDEPCSALDPLSSAVVEQLIMRLRGKYTVVIVTHNLAQAKRIANYVGFFWVKQQAGTLIEFNQTTHLFDTPQHDLTAAYIAGLAG